MQCTDVLTSMALPVRNKGCGRSWWSTHQVVTEFTSVCDSTVYALCIIVCVDVYNGPVCPMIERHSVQVVSHAVKCSIESFRPGGHSLLQLYTMCVLIKNNRLPNADCLRLNPTHPLLRTDTKYNHPLLQSKVPPFADIQKCLRTGQDSY
jgi:hypothetical protein